MSMFTSSSTSILPIGEDILSLVQKAGVGGFATSQKLIRKGGEVFCGLFWRHFCLTHRTAQVRSALEDSEMFCFSGDCLGYLDACGAGADDGDAFATYIHAILRPEGRVAYVSLEGL